MVFFSNNIIDFSLLYCNNAETKNYDFLSKIISSCPELCYCLSVLFLTSQVQPGLLYNDLCNYFIHSLSRPWFVKIQNVHPPGPTMCHLSHVICHVSCVRFPVSIFFGTKCWSQFGEGLILTGPTQSSFFKSYLDTTTKKHYIFDSNSIATRYSSDNS